MNLRNLSCGAVIGIVSCASPALTLGPVRGDVVLGQPLDLVFELQLEGGADVTNSCVAAEVSFSDSRVEPSRIQVNGVPGTSGSNALVRVRSSSIVDEPVATVLLSAGCSNKTVRRYTFLSQLSQSTAATAQNTPQATTPLRVAPDLDLLGRGTAKGPSADGPAASRSARDGARTEAGPRRERRPSGEGRTVAAGTARGTVSTAAKTSGAAAVETNAGGSRLVLDPSDAFIFEPISNLKPSAVLSSVPVENSPQRAEAAALWAYLNADPQTILGRAQRVEALEADVGKLQAAAATDRAALAELRTALEDAREDRSRNPLVIALAALLLLALGAAAYFWRRARNPASAGHDWWRKEAGETGFHVSRELGGDEAAGGASRFGQPVFAPSITHVDVDLDNLSAEPVQSRTSLAQPWAPSGTGGISVTHDFQASSRAPLAPAARPARAINPEELFDIQQHADFFMSLGQYDQAIAVLKKHIDEKPDTSPLAYLDLLKLYHMLSRIEDYNQLRSTFNRTFSGTVPMFTAFNKQGQGLEDYPAVVQRIQEVWFTPQASQALETAIFRDPGVPIESVDLEAFRDLLMLHGVSGTLPSDPATVRSAGSRTALSAAATGSQQPMTGRSTTGATRADQPPSVPDRPKPVEVPFVALPASAPQAALPAAASAAVSLEPPISALPDLVFAPDAAQDAAQPAALASGILDFELDVDLSEGPTPAAAPSPPGMATTGGSAAKLAAFPVPAPSAPVLSSASVSVDATKTQPGALPRPNSGNDNLIDFDVFDLPDDAKDSVEPQDPRKKG